MQGEIHGLAFHRFAWPQFPHPVPIPSCRDSTGSVTTVELMLYTGRMSLVYVWPTSEVLSMRVSLQLCGLHRRKELGLLLRTFRLIWLLHFCWSMLCSLLMAPCLICTEYFGDCVLLKISHPFQALDGSTICRKVMQVCVKLPCPVNGDLHRNRHSNIFQWSETWENQLGPFSSTIVGCHEQAHPCTLAPERM